MSPSLQDTDRAPSPSLLQKTDQVIVKNIQFKVKNKQFAVKRIQFLAKKHENGPLKNEVGIDIIFIKSSFQKTPNVQKPFVLANSDMRIKRCKNEWRLHFAK